MYILRGTMTTFDGTKENTKKIKDGSFQNNEHLIQKCDIVVSNPPFSLFTEYMKMLLNSGKGFLILGPVRSGYALMQYFDNNQIHFGTARGMDFDTPSGEIKSLRNCGWFTNLDSDVEIKRNIRKLKDTDYFENNQDIIEIPAMYMPNLDKNGILHTSNGDYKKLPGGRRINKNQRIKLQRVNEKKTFVITERQERVLKEYLDKDVAMPMYNYLKDGKIFYHSDGHIFPNKNLVPLFIKYIIENLNDREYKQFCYRVRNNDNLKNIMHPRTDFFGRRFIDYIIIKNGEIYHLNKQEKKNFLEDSFRTFFNATEFAYWWDDFMKYLNTYKTNNEIKNSFHKNLPSNIVLQNPEVIKTTWLIHFTHKFEDALDVCQNGFKKGVPKDRIEDVAYTERFASDEKINGSYNFAYDTKEIDSCSFKANIPKDEWQFDNKFDQKAWERAIHYAVMFRSGGISANHITDSENQVIFNNKMARDFVLIRFEWNKDAVVNNKDNRSYLNPKGEKADKLVGNVVWQVLNKDLKVIYYNKSISKVIRWVKDNFDQYRKQLCWK